MPGIIRIDMPFGGETGKTSVSPESTMNNMAVSPSSEPRGLSARSTIMLGYSYMVAQATWQTSVGEIRAGGNEELATVLENGTKAVGVITAAVATKGLSLIPETVNVITTSITRSREMARQNRQIILNNELRGARNNFRGSIYE